MNELPTENVEADILRSRLSHEAISILKAIDILYEQERVFGAERIYHSILRSIQEQQQNHKRRLREIESEISISFSKEFEAKFIDYSKERPPLNQVVRLSGGDGLDLGVGYYTSQGARHVWGERFQQEKIRAWRNLSPDELVELRTGMRIYLERYRYWGEGMIDPDIRNIMDASGEHLIKNCY